MNDLQLLAASFDVDSLPKENEHLRHYFTDPPQIAFMIWYPLFRELQKPGMFERMWQCFCDHTGFVMSKAWLYRMTHRFRALERAMKEAEGDPARVALVRSGKYRPTEGYKRGGKGPESWNIPCGWDSDPNGTQRRLYPDRVTHQRTGRRKRTNKPKPPPAPGGNT